MAEHTNLALETPVLFVVFNRPSTTQQVFDAIRQAKPARLYIVADGERSDHPDDHKNCSKVHDIVSAVDWPCQEKVMFRDYNAGCGRGVSDAISWFFEHEEEGIILEDDCLPSPDFFPFCTELLQHYRHDNRVMQIGGNNFLPTQLVDPEYSYFFSNHNFIWGWATWRRAWHLFDFSMQHYDEVMRKHYHDHYFGTFDEQDYLKYVFDQTYRHIDDINIWDYQWHFSRMVQAGLSIVPSKNLVVNLGFGHDATHTSNFQGAITDLRLERMDFPLRHPEFMMVDVAKDSALFNRTFTTPWSRTKQRIKKIIPEPVLHFGKRLLGYELTEP